MKTWSFLCDWYAPNDAASPLMVVIQMPDDYEFNGMQDVPELWTAFLASYEGQGYDVEPDGCIYDYVYEIFSVPTDLTDFESPSDFQLLRVIVP